MKVETLQEAMELLKEARSSSECSLSDASATIGVNRAILSRWLSGEKVPSLARWLECLAALGYVLQAFPVGVDQEVTPPQPAPSVEPPTQKQPDHETAPADFFQEKNFLIRDIGRFVFEGHPEPEAFGYFRRLYPALTREHITYAVNLYRRRR